MNPMHARFREVWSLDTQRVHLSGAGHEKEKPCTSRPEVNAVNWRKNSHSMNNGDGVEVAAPADRPFVHGSVIGFAAAEWDAFLTDAKLGDFDGREAAIGRWAA